MAHSIRRKAPARRECPRDCDCFCCQQTNRLKASLSGDVISQMLYGADPAKVHDEPVPEDSFCPCGKKAHMYSGLHERLFCSEECIQRKMDDPSWGDDIRRSAIKTDDAVMNMMMEEDF